MNTSLQRHNDSVLADWESKMLNPDYSFYGCQSENVETEIEKWEDEYTLSDEQVEALKKECESDDFEHLDKYDWAELLEEYTGERVNSDDIVKVDLETNTITYLKQD